MYRLTHLSWRGLWLFVIVSAFSCATTVKAPIQVTATSNVYTSVVGEKAVWVGEVWVAVDEADVVLAMSRDGDTWVTFKCEE